MTANPATHPVKLNSLLFTRSCQLFPTIRSIISESAHGNTPSVSNSIRSLYSGYTPYLLRAGTIVTSYKMLNGSISKSLQPTNDQNQLSIINKLHNNTIALVAASAPMLSAATYPLSTIYRSMQVHGMLTQCTTNNTTITYQAKHYNTVRSACSDIYRTHGMRGFYRGIVPHMFVTLPSCVLVLATSGFININ